MKADGQTYLAWQMVYCFQSLLQMLVSAKTKTEIKHDLTRCARTPHVPSSSCCRSATHLTFPLLVWLHLSAHTHTHRTVFTAVPWDEHVHHRHSAQLWRQWRHYNICAKVCCSCFVHIQFAHQQQHFTRFSSLWLHKIPAWVWYQYREWV